MDEALYVAATGLDAVSRMLETVTRNTVNADTPGYMRRSAVVQRFEEMLGDAGERADLLGLKESIDFSPGELRASDEPFSFALEGGGFFAVQSEDGNRYLTRNGDFSLDADGRLVTRAGDAVLAEGGGDLRFDPRRGPVEVSERGVVNQGELVLGRLMLREVDDTNRLQAHGETLFALGEGQRDQRASETIVRRGYLEMPRYKGPQGLVNMLAASKQFEATARAMNAIDQSNEAVLRAFGR